jgi:hypothetical protein
MNDYKYDAKLGQNTEKGKKRLYVFKIKKIYISIFDFYLSLIHSYKKKMELNLDSCMCYSFFITLKCRALSNY